KKTEAVHRNRMPTFRRIMRSRMGVFPKNLSKYRTKSVEYGLSPVDRTDEVSSLFRQTLPEAGVADESFNGRSECRRIIRDENVLFVLEIQALDPNGGRNRWRPHHERMHQLRFRSCTIKQRNDGDLHLFQIWQDRGDPTHQSHIVSSATRP